jgi:nucleoside-diphosphate kinase
MRDILVLLKPDAVQKGLCRDIIVRLRGAGFKIKEAYAGSPNQKLVLQHCAHLRGKVLQRNLEFLCGGIVVMLVVEGDIPSLRKQVGCTEPAKAGPGTIRGDLSGDSIVQADREQRALHNLIHASDSKESAAKEMRLWREHFVVSPAEQGITILQKTNDGNDLAPHHLYLLQEAINGQLNAHGKEEYQLLYAEVTSGLYSCLFKETRFPQHVLALASEAAPSPG